MSKTPSQEWASRIAEYKNTCRNIVKSSDSIRFAGVINEFGRTLAGAKRNDFTPLLDRERARNEFFVVSALLSMRKRNSASMGALDHMVLRHKKVTILALLDGTIAYYISVSPREKDLDELASCIKRLI